MKKANYSGQKLYIGIDVHLKQWNVGIYTESSFHKVFQQPPEANVLRIYMDRHFPGGEYYTVYEAGLTGFKTHRDLSSCGFNNIVVHPSDVPTKHKERLQKRDAVDACKLGRSLRNKELEGIYVPSLKVQQDRELIRYRCNKLVGKQTRIKNQIKSFLALYDYRYEGGSASWTKAYQGWLKNLEISNTSARQSLDHLLEELEYYQKKLRQVDRQIVALSRQPEYQDQVKLLKSVPGVGLLVSMILLTELGDMLRYENLDHLCAYVGLIPNVSGSGDTLRVGRQTKRGNKLVRRMLVQSAWVAKGQDPGLLACYEELVKRMHGNKAIIRIEKKLLNRIRRVLLSGQPYQMGIK